MGFIPHKLIEQLPEQYLMVVTLFHLEEFSVEGINEIIGMQEVTIKSYLYRARNMLKDSQIRGQGKLHF